MLHQAPPVKTDRYTCLSCETHRFLNGSSPLFGFPRRLPACYFLPGFGGEMLNGLNQRHLRHSALSVVPLSTRGSGTWPCEVVSNASRSKQVSPSV
jgi:hypothetical protein